MDGLLHHIQKAIAETNLVPLCIVGPTGSGKTILAESLAQQLNGALLSADSMQIYRSMDIGTGKVDARRAEIPYYGIDIADPGESYSVSLYQEYARTTLMTLLQEGKNPVICGGTGLYIRSIFDDMNYSPGEQENNSVREHYQLILEERGSQAIWDILMEKDPQSALTIHPNNSRRVIRALELCELGESYKNRLETLHQVKQVIPARFYALDMPREVLYQRINHRVDEMIQQGLIEEVQNLLEKGFYQALTAPQAIGYKEIIAYFEGQYSLDSAIESIKQSTRRYAKRQISWFKADKRVVWLDYKLPLEEKINRIISL